jgi:hypothetical protein
VSFPIEHGDFPWFFVCLPEGNLVTNCHENGNGCFATFLGLVFAKKAGDIYGIH